MNPGGESSNPGAHGGAYPRDQFLSEEDLDLASLTWEELLLWWDLFLRQAQASNDLDVDEYSHRVLALPRSEWPAGLRDMGRASLPAASE